MTALTDFFGDVIHTYTRRQAIEDGILVQLSGPGYEGDQWALDMCREAGFRIPVAMTVETFTDCICPIEGEGEKLAPCQDAEGRLWDILSRLYHAICANRGPTDRVEFDLWSVPNVPEGSERENPPRPELIRFKAVCGPDDDGASCITIMYPCQD